MDVNEFCKERGFVENFKASLLTNTIEKGITLLIKDVLSVEFDNNGCGCTKLKIQCLGTSKKEIYIVPFCRRKVVETLEIKSGDKFTIGNIKIEENCYAELENEAYFAQLIAVDPNNVCVEKNSDFFLTEDSYLLYDNRNSQYHIDVDKTITIISGMPIYGQIKTCSGLLVLGKVTYIPTSINKISRHIEFCVQTLNLNSNGDVLSTFTSAKLSLGNIVEIFGLVQDMLEGKKISFVVGEGIIVVMINDENEENYGNGTTIEDVDNNQLFMLNILMNKNDLKLKIGDYVLPVQFTYDQCGSDLFSECTKKFRLRNCKGEFKEKCEKCINDNVNGVLDACGQCFKDKKELESNSKCICESSECSVCTSPKKVVRLTLGDSEKFLCKECEGEKITCNGICETSCIRVQQLLHGLLISDNFGHCKMQSITGSDECQLAKLERQSSIQTPLYEWKITSGDCPDKKYKVICDETKETEEFDYKKKEYMSCVFTKYGSTEPLKISCKNAVGLSTFSTKLTKHNEIVEFSKMGPSTEELTVFVSNKISPIKIKDTLDVWLFDYKVVIESPEVECDVPKLLDCQVEMDAGFIFTFNRAMKINKDEEDCGKLLGENGKIAAMNILNYEKLGKCFAADCQDDSFGNTFEGNCNLISVVKGCSNLEATVKKEATVVCKQNSVEVEIEMKTAFSYIYSISKLNNNFVICEITSKTKSFDKITHIIKNFTPNEGCFDLTLISGSNHMIGATKEVAFMATDIEGEDDPVEHTGTELPLGMLRQLEDKTFNVSARRNGLNRFYGNVFVNHYSAGYKGGKNYQFPCDKVSDQITGDTLAKLYFPENELTVSERECFFKKAEAFSKTMFSECDTIQTLHCTALLINNYGEEFKLPFEAIIKLSNEKIPQLLVKKLPQTETCDCRVDITASNINDMAANVVLTLKSLTTGATIEMKDSEVCPFVEGNDARRICCFNEENVLSEEGTFKLAAALKDEANPNEEITFDYKKEPNLIVTLTPPKREVEEMDTFELFVETNIPATFVCQQVANGLNSGIKVTFKFIIQEENITCTVKTETQIKYVVADASVMSKIKVATLKDDELKKNCIAKEDDEKRNECKNVLFVFLGKKNNQIGDSNVRRRRRAVENNDLCEPLSEEDCYFFKDDILQKVKYSVGSDIVNTAKPSVCSKACRYQVPCQQSFGIVNDYFNKRLSNKFNSEERQFFSCGFSAVIYPFQMNNFASKSVSTYIETLPKIQQSVILEFANGKKLESIDNEFVMYKHWYFDGIETNGKFEIGDSSIMLTSKFQTQYETWECTDLENCTGIYFTASKMKLYYNPVTAKYEDPMAMSYVPVTPLTDVHNIHFFWVLGEIGQVSEIGEVKINPTGMYKITMKLQIKDFNGAARCHSYNNETQSWEPSNINANIDADMVTCECPKEGPCAVFEVDEDLLDVITSEPPEVLATTKMPEVSETDMSSTMTYKNDATMSTNSKVETEEESLTTKKMTSTVIKTTEMTKPNEQTSTEDTQSEVPYAVVEEKIKFALQENFDEICKGDKEKCEDYLCNQVKLKLPISSEKILKCDIYKGSIIFILLIRDKADNIIATIMNIKYKVVNSELIILLPDGSLSTADKDSFEAGDQVTASTPEDEEDDKDHNAIIVALSIVLSIGLVVIFVAIVMYKKNRQKVAPSPTPSSTHMTKPSGDAAA